MTDPNPALPAAPTINSVLPGNQSVLVTFTAPEGDVAITGYRVRTNQGQSTDAPGSPVTLTGLENGENYTVAVRALSDAGEGAESDWSAEVVPCTAPSPPGFLTASADDGQSVVQFKPSAPNGSAITGYAVTLTPESPGVPVTATGPGSPITVTGLTNGVTYGVVITAANGAGSSGESTPAATVTPVGAGPEEPYKPWPDCAGFALDKVVNTAQLNAELNEALGSPVQVTVTSTVPGSATGYLWIMPSSVNQDTVQEVLAAHVPDWNWGIPESVLAYRTVLAKVQQDSEVTLTDDEVQAAVKGMLIQMSNLG